MRPRSAYPPKTPAQRQAKCRAIKRGKWHTYPNVLPEPPPGLPSPTGRAAIALPPPAGPTQGPRALPAPPAPPVTAIEKAAPAGAPAAATALAIPSAAAALALPDVGAAGDALRLSLPPAVAARLRSLLERHDAGKPLTAAERAEAQGLLDIAEFFVVQRLRLRLAA
jgi:hypothetical protein